MSLTIATSMIHSFTSRSNSITLLILPPVMTNWMSPNLTDRGTEEVSHYISLLKNNIKPPLGFLFDQHLNFLPHVSKIIQLRNIAEITYTLTKNMELLVHTLATITPSSNGSTPVLWTVLPSTSTRSPKCSILAINKHWL